MAVGVRRIMCRGVPTDIDMRHMVQSVELSDWVSESLRAFALASASFRSLRWADLLPLSV
jgi:hypothetical protein